MGADPSTLVLAKLVAPGTGRQGGIFGGYTRPGVQWGRRSLRQKYSARVSPDGLRKLYHGVNGLAGGAKLADRIQFAFGAEFVELRVHARTREIRCSRIVGAFAAGRIVNPLTAESHLMGGLIWGISAALHEATEIDRRRARYCNADLAEYLIPVNADIGEVTVIMVPEEDRQVNDLGIKGLGELGNVGTNAAVANAAYHATGLRIRELPIRLEKLLDSPAI
jgi:xanthine dehydrogenase YagR molybdenum-binding subunit